MAAIETSDKRKRIVEAAFGLILSSGADGLSTSTICEVSGISRSTLYRHFPTREVLLEAVIGHLADEVEQRLVALIAERPDPADRLDIIIDLLIERMVGRIGQRLLQADPGFVMKIFDQTLARNVDIFNHALGDVYRSADALTGQKVDRSLVGNVMTRLCITLDLLPTPALPGDLRQVMRALFRALLLDLHVERAEPDRREQTV